MPGNVEIVEGDALEVDFRPLDGRPVSPRRQSSLQRRHRAAAAIHRPSRADLRRHRHASKGSCRARARRARTRATTARSRFSFSTTRTPTWGFTVPPGAFTPPPKVDSAVIRLDWRPGVADFPAFTDFVHRAFSSRRKKLVNNLGAILPGRSRDDIAEILRTRGRFRRCPRRKRCPWKNFFVCIIKLVNELDRTR